MAVQHTARALAKRVVKSRAIGPATAWLGRRLSFAGYRLLAAAERPVVESRPSTTHPGEVWIDVGAHQNPLNAPAGTLLYAFEPTLAFAAANEGHPGTISIAAAISDRAGIATFHLVDDANNNSLLPMDPATMEQFAGIVGKTVGASTYVPTIRLDDFMDAAGIDEIAFLKVDTEGHDLAVLRSLSDRIANVRRIQVETFAVPQYLGAENTPDAVIAFMREHGFEVSARTPIFFGQGEDITFERPGGGERSH